VHLGIDALMGHDYLTSCRVDHSIPKGKSVTKTNRDIGDLVKQEMLGEAKAIEAATQRLQQLMRSWRARRARMIQGGAVVVRSSELAVGLQVHDSIL
jgi:hypothetical protein